MTEQPRPAPAPEGQPSAPAPEERPIWKLDRSEQRILLITFVGGVASIVVAAGIIGGAIANARRLNNFPHKTELWIAIGSYAAVFAVMLAGAIWFQGYASRHPKMYGRAIRRSALFIGSLAGLGLAFALLTLIGLAAGIH